VTKGILYASGLGPYGAAWNDQPPLHTAILGWWFWACGPSIGVARALGIGFGCSMLAACWVLVRCRAGTLAAFVAATTLLLSPQVLELGVSVMLEVPAIGTALWALWPVLRWQERAGGRLVQGAGRWWLVLSGAILGVALQIKLTAALVAPALAVEILIGTAGPRVFAGPPGQCASQARPAAYLLPRARAAARSLAAWGGGLAGSYLLLALCLGHVPLEVLKASHFSAGTMAHGRDFAFSALILLDHTEGHCGGGAALLLIAWRREWRRMAFPLVLLLTAGLVHWQHRPWWAYYYLHFAVPLAWLSGYAVATLLDLAWERAPKGLIRPPFAALGCAAAASLLLALLGGYGGERFWCAMQRIRLLPRVATDPLVAKMREYAPVTRWAYARDTIYPFHARVLVIPELAVLPLKRFWSGQITEEGIWETVRRYRPEQMLLGTEPISEPFKEFVESGYRLVYQDAQRSLYVAKTLVKE